MLGAIVTRTMEVAAAADVGAFTAEAAEAAADSAGGEDEEGEDEEVVAIKTMVTGGAVGWAKVVGYQKFVEVGEGALINSTITVGTAGRER
jgi:hypothetical protein